MFRTISDFTQSWKSESDVTLKVLRALTDESLSQRVSPEGRTVGKIAWHIIQSVPEMLSTAKLPVAFSGEPPQPARAADFVTAWQQWSQGALAAVQENWTDASLQEEVDMYGEKWTRGFSLGVLVVHAIHHRGQMTVLMRQAGLVVPGVYGPAREEWAAFGMPVQE